MSTAQSFISGSLTDGEEPIMFANIALYDTTDVMIKVETSDIDGKFTFTNISDGVYYIVSSFIGYQDYRSEDVVLAGSPVALGSIAMSIQCRRHDQQCRRQWARPTQKSTRCHGRQ